MTLGILRETAYPCSSICFARMYPGKLSPAAASMLTNPAPAAQCQGLRMLGEYASIVGGDVSGYKIQTRRELK